MKIGAKVAGHGGYVTFQLAKVAVPRSMLQKILNLIDDLRRKPVPAQAEEIRGEVKTMGQLRLDGGNYRKMALRHRQPTKSRLSDGCGGKTITMSHL